MSELSEWTTFWAGVKGAIASAVAGVIREEEAVDVGPGSVTVRPYGEEGTQELRHLAGAVVRPGDRVVVLRLPALKLVLGTPTVRGVASVLPIPFLGFGGVWGRSDLAARADHHHGLPWGTNSFYGPSTHGFGMAGDPTTITLTANRVECVPFLVAQRTAIVDFSFDVETAVAGSTARMALYRSRGSTVWGPGDLVVASPTIATDTTGYKRPTGKTSGDTIAVIDPGWYWLALAATHAITVAAATPAFAPRGRSDVNHVAWTKTYVNQGDITAPDPWPTSGSFTVQGDYALTYIRTGTIP